MPGNVYFDKYEVALSLNYTYNKFEVVFYLEQPDKPDEKPIYDILKEVLERDNLITNGTYKHDSDDRLVMEFDCTPGCDEDALLEPAKRLFEDLNDITEKTDIKKSDEKSRIKNIIKDYRAKNGLNVSMTTADISSSPTTPDMKTPPASTKRPPLSSQVRWVHNEHPATRTLRRVLSDYIDYFDHTHVVPNRYINDVCRQMEICIDEYNNTPNREKLAQRPIIRKKLLPLVTVALIEGGCPKEILHKVAVDYILAAMDQISLPPTIRQGGGYRSGR